jgi:hypothetical protein
MQALAGLVYATVLVPFIGQPLVVFASSILYYRWRKWWPKAALRFNVHAWVAVALNIGLTSLFCACCADEEAAARLARRICSWSRGARSVARTCGSGGRCAGAIAVVESTRGHRTH